MFRLGPIIRGFAGASLVAVAFALAILIIGTPIALIVGAAHAGLSWLIGLVAFFH